jgi:quercetin dioxygenase-like cupin family protein
MEIFRAGETPSRQGASEWFTGRVRIDALFNPVDPDRVQGAHVTFEPGPHSLAHPSD